MRPPSRLPWALRRDRRGLRFQAEKASAVPVQPHLVSPQAPMARVGDENAWIIQLTRQAGCTTATRRCVAPTASTKRSTPVAAGPRCRSSRRLHQIAGAEAECGHRHAACSRSSNSTARRPARLRAQGWPARWATSVPDRRRGQVLPSPPGFREGRLRHGQNRARPPPARRAYARSQRYRPGTAVPRHRLRPNAPRETRAGNPEASRRYRRSEAR